MLEASQNEQLCGQIRFRMVWIKQGVGQVCVLP